MKKIFLYSVLVFVIFVVGCSSTKTITIVNRTDTDLSNLIIQSSWIHSHSYFKKSRPKPIAIELLEVGEAVVVDYKGKINGECVSVSSETVTLQLIDCIQERQIKEQNIRVIIYPKDVILEY
jgi:hypothetical protein